MAKKTAAPKAAPPKRPARKKVSAATAPAKKPVAGPKGAERPEATPAEPAQEPAPLDPVPGSIAELTADAANPRKISDEASEALRRSLQRFGDLAGITFNLRTGELVTGHQRVSQLQRDYPEAAIERRPDGSAVLRAGGESFAVRLVDWSLAKQRAANVAANHLRMQGQFTDDVADYLLEIQDDLVQESAGLLEDLLLVELIEADEKSKETAAAKKKAKEAYVSDVFQLVVECRNEAHQKALYEQLTGAGEQCKLITI